MLEITGKTGLLAVIGHPIRHSLSPQIQNRFASKLKLPYAYLAFDILPDQIGQFVDAARTLKLSGFNLTMPLKEYILPYIDELDDDARLYGAVNTVVMRDGSLHGYNTDGDGFVLSLHHNGFSFNGNKAVILGTGGAAKAVAIALFKKGLRALMASRRADSLTPIYPGIEYCHWSDLDKELDGCSLLVNATPLGMHGMREEFSDFLFLDALEPGAMVYDLIYAPRETRLLLEAKRRDLRTMNGLPHLIYQAALSFALFTGEMPPEKEITQIIDLFG